MSPPAAISRAIRTGPGESPRALGDVISDALAYCAWLGETLRDWDETPEPLAGLPRGGHYRLTLPSEAEWERPRGVAKYTPIPGAMTRRRHAAPTTPTGIDGTSPVGCFPAAPRLAAAWIWPAMSGSGHGTYGAGWLDDDNLTILDLENIILTSQIIERQRDRQTREVKCVVRGFTLDGCEAETIVKIGPTGRLVVITEYVA